MTDDQRPVLQSTVGYMSTRVRRRKVMVMLAVLLLVVVLCVTAIGVMLQRLEAKNANFHPPMTSSERELLMPNEPLLDTTPSVDGLRYQGVQQGVGDSGRLLNGTEDSQGRLVPLKSANPKTPVRHSEGLSHVH